jgi:hypothetical protein
MGWHSLNKYLWYWFYTKNPEKEYQDHMFTALVCLFVKIVSKVSSGGYAPETALFFGLALLMDFIVVLTLVLRFYR